MTPDQIEKWNLYLFFVDAVVDRLERGREIERSDFLSSINFCYNMDFSILDAVLWIKNTEEWTEKFNPNLSEEKALSNMREIGSKYPKYVALTKVKR